MTSPNQPCERDKAAAKLLDAIGSRMQYERMLEDAKQRMDMVRRELEVYVDGMQAAQASEELAWNEIIAMAKGTIK